MEKIPKIFTYMTITKQNSSPATKLEDLSIQKKKKATYQLLLKSFCQTPNIYSKERSTSVEIEGNKP
jgi:hypothetical protein